jgi:hypothetical protein
MTSRTKIQLGLTALATAIAAIVAACTVPPIGRTEYCYWYTEWTVYNPATSVSSPPPTRLECRDTPIDSTGTTTTSTVVGYVAPIPAGTRVVK